MEQVLVRQPIERLANVISHVETGLNGRVMPERREVSRRLDGLQGLVLADLADADLMCHGILLCWRL